ncbi:MAG: sigma-70 family RNA polymerase sigma factor [Agathobacter sp.]|nr:sigma-70 family RNA polymerase sigma factor [Agathobacter sp.]
MEYKEYSDEELIVLLRKGEDSIMDFLMNKYKPLVRKKTNALYLIGGENDDLIQEGMIGLFKAIRDFQVEKETSFYHFAEICITRQLYSAVEASNRKKHIPLNTYVSLFGDGADQEIELEDQLGSHQENPEKLVIEQEIWRDFYKKLFAGLSSMEQKVLGLYLEGSNYVQIAEIMGKEPKSIDNALQRIRQKIKTLQLKERG